MSDLKYAVCKDSERSFKFKFLTYTLSNPF